MTTKNSARIGAASAAALAMTFVQLTGIDGARAAPGDLSVDFSPETGTLTLVVSGPSAAALDPRLGAGEEATLELTAAPGSPPVLAPASAAARPPREPSFDPPTSGTASFDTAVTGVFAYGGQPANDREVIDGRGVVTADFGAGTVDAEFPDFDFTVDGHHIETTRLGHDFGMSLQGFIEGDTLDLFGQTTRRTGPGVIGVSTDMIADGTGSILSFGGDAAVVAGMFEASSVEPELTSDLLAAFAGVAGLPPAPDIPTTGVVTFDTDLTGIFTYDNFPLINQQLVVGRGDLQIDFGAGSLTGLIPDVDFIDRGVISEADTIHGQDFGVTFSGTVQGDQIDLFAASVGGDLDLEALGSGVVTSAPGRLQIAADLQFGEIFNDPPTSMRAGVEGVSRP